jgi:predicted aspartyl protease
MKRNFLAISQIILCFTLASCVPPPAENDAPKSALARADIGALLTADGYDAIKLEKIGTGHDLLTVKLNGVEGYFILDTGASDSVIDSNLRETYHILETDFLSSEIGAGAGGEIEARSYTLESVSLEGRTVKLAKIATTDLSELLSVLSRVAGKPVHGIIGQDLLTLEGGILDIAGQTLYLGSETVDPSVDPSCNLAFHQAMKATGYICLELTKLTTGHETIPVMINGRAGTFVVDSGTRASFVHLADTEKFDLNDGKHTDSTLGAGGSVQVNNFEIDSFAIAGHAIELKRIGAFDLSPVVDAIADRAGADVDGVVGQDVLGSQYAVIDVSNQRLLVYGDPKALSE